MRIGIIAHLKYPISEPFAGGLEMHTYLLASQLRKRGHDVVLFASTRSDPELGLEALCDQTSLDAFGRKEEENAEFFREHHAYLSLMNRLRLSDFDVIHNNSLHYLPVVLADALQMPVLTSLHTPPFALLESALRIAGNGNARFVAVSDAIIQQWSPITPIAATIANGIDLSGFSFRGQPAEDPYAIWYGRIVAEKGLHLAMDAAELLGIPLRFAGPVSDRVYFDKEIVPRLNSSTTYCGHLGHRELARVIGGARVFLCTPCWQEPYGLVVAESLACGVPVAAFAMGGIPEILDPLSGVLATPGDVRSLADAARRAQGLARTDCRRRAEAVCNAEVMVDGYEDAYLKAIRSHSAVDTETPAALMQAGIAASLDHVVHPGGGARST